MGASRTTVIQWRGRYQSRGVPGLEDHDRPGRPREVDHAAIVTATLPPPPPKELAVTVDAAAGRRAQDQPQDRGSGVEGVRDQASPQAIASQNP